jgi:RHS repeat-associated protein
MSPDKLFTGQRLDSTGLYYYGARYYDATIGRFISADTIVPDPANPQAYNKYSYCINNPLSCIDPSGHDYVFVCGSGGRPSDWNTMIEALNITDERIIFISESPQGSNFGFPFEIGDQVVGLEFALTEWDLTDIKLIGHSEGAAAIVDVLDKIANDDNYLAGTTVRDELEAAIMLENITGDPSWIVGDWSDHAYDYLPDRLAKKLERHVKLLDVWNLASIVHESGIMPGWGMFNSYWYWYSHGIFSIMANHNDPLTNPDVIDEIKETLGIE